MHLEYILQAHGLMTGSKKADNLTYIIDSSNSNPETAVTYSNGATGKNPAPVGGGASNWDNVYPYNQIKPCLLKNGIVQYYLNPNDYTKKIDGTASDITSGNDGDVMIEFPVIYWNMISGSVVNIAKTAVDPSYKALAHTVGASVRDKIYIGAYLGSEVNGKLRSLSGKTPAANQTIGAFRTLAQANGTGYQQLGYYQVLMLQHLFMLKYKNRDSQAALGRGFVDGNTAAINTGGTNTKGMDFGESTGKLQMKFLGIEDFWGNIRQWVDGLFSDANWNILISNQSTFNDTGAGYTNFGQGATANVSGYVSAIQGSTEKGFITKTGGGSETTHYADSGGLYASCLPYFGGHGSNASYAGAFSLYVSYSASSTNAYIGGRLVFLG